MAFAQQHDAVQGGVLLPDTAARETEALPCSGGRWYGRDGCLPLSGLVSVDSAEVQFHNLDTASEPHTTDVAALLHLRARLWPLTRSGSTIRREYEFAVFWT